MNEFKVKNLLEQLERHPEERIQEFLSFYTCPTNKDIEVFLREKAISFSKTSSARTFLVSDADTDQFVGYFTISPKSLVIEDFSEVSKTLEKKIKWFSDVYRIGKGEDEQTIQIASMTLIAQLGKNYTNGGNKLITGKQLLEVAFEKIIEIQREQGGRFILVECEDTSNLISYYTANGFSRLQNRATGKGESDYFVQLVRTT